MSGKPYSSRQAVPYVEFVAEPVTAAQEIRDRLSGDVTSDEMYQDSLHRMLRHQGYKLQAFEWERQYPQGAGGSPRAVPGTRRRPHWTMNSEDEDRNFSQAYGTARSLYHNTLRPFPRDELPPTANTMYQKEKQHEKQKGKQRTYVANKTAVAVTTRLWSARYFRPVHRSEDPDIEADSMGLSDPKLVMKRSPIRNYRTMLDVPMKIPRPPTDSSRTKKKAKEDTAGNDGAEAGPTPPSHQRKRTSQ